MNWPEGMIVLCWPYEWLDEAKEWLSKNGYNGSNVKLYKKGDSVYAEWKVRS